MKAANPEMIFFLRTRIKLLFIRYFKNLNFLAFLSDVWHQEATARSRNNCPVAQKIKFEHVQEMKLRMSEYHTRALTLKLLSELVW